MRQNEVLAYTAGIIDGEGSICIVKFHRNRNRGYYFQLGVSVGNTNEYLMQWLKMHFGGYFAPLSRELKDTQKQVWQWMVTGNKAAEFLVLVLPYLQLKKSQAELAIKFQKNRKRGRYSDEKQVALEEADRILMSSMNKKGPR